MECQVDRGVREGGCTTTQRFKYGHTCGRVFPYPFTETTYLSTDVRRSQSPGRTTLWSVERVPRGPVPGLRGRRTRQGTLEAKRPSFLFGFVPPDPDAPDGFRRETEGSGSQGLGKPGEDPVLQGLIYPTPPTEDQRHPDVIPS